MTSPKKLKKKKYTKRYSICVVGAGHVGLVAAACFAELNHKVVCVDSDEHRIQSLKKKKLPFYEPELEPLVKKNIKSGNLSFSSALGEGIKKSEVIFLAVGTPPQVDGSADLSSVENVARIVARNLDSYKLIVEKSTVPVKTGRKVKEAIHRYKKSNVDFDVASNPEFLREGKAVYDFFYPDRIVVGVESKRAENILKDIYASLKTPLIVTDINTAELIKHASNSFLATKISFINVVSHICDLAGADVEKVSLAMGLDKRIGKEFLQAGIGYGGSCFPKDVAAFIYIAKKLGYELNLLKEVENINKEQWIRFVEKVKEHLWILRDKKIAILGLSFKPDTDDMRCAPSVNIIESFINEGAHLILFDPQAQNQAKKIFKTSSKLKFSQDPYSAVKDCDCLCFLTEWDQFHKLDFKKIKKLMHYPFIADGRNMFDGDALRKLEFDYIGMGKL
ncbi:MAG: UDP-glucose/GDP-mannose dehydrogenase family protein [Candidatus Omnitrophica bacterium]|nr:UDP-glucose/GDP-mannose dehydrogenase family protein [Candidatus Omnitrophota bacterium]